MIKFTSKVFEQLTPSEVLFKIANLREKRGKGKKEQELLAEISDKALDYYLSLLFEKALFCQHEVMEEKDKTSLEKMKREVVNIYRLVRSLKLERWYSRVYRFEGKAMDYSKKYNEACVYYKKAIKNARKDPEYLEKKVPRVLEYQAFLANSTMMSGEVKKGMVMSRKIWEEFIKGDTGIGLKKQSYTTWAIWATGIPIRVARAAKLFKEINKNEVASWLDEASKLIVKPVTNDSLVGSVDFEIRKAEIIKAKKLLDL
jgi:hypothetical protein